MVVEMKTPLGVKVPGMVKALFAFLLLMVIGILSIPVVWADFLVMFSTPDDGVVEE